MNMVSSEITMTASEFKAKCLDIFKRLSDHRLSKVTVTKRGKVVAEVVAASDDPSSEEVIAGFRRMSGSAHVGDGVDLTKPVFEGSTDAELGILHR